MSTTIVDNPQALFKALAERLNGPKATEAQARVTAHIRAVSGHTTLPSYHNNGASDEEKAATYRLCLKAVLKGDWSELKGQIPAGQVQKPADPDQPAVTPDETPKRGYDDPGYGKTRMPETPESEVQPRPRFTVTDAKPDDDAAQALASALQRLLKPQAQEVKIDEDTIRHVANQVCVSVLKEQTIDMQARLAAKVDEYLAKIPPRDVLEIRKWDGTVKELTGLRHKQMADILRFTTARTTGGFVPPLWLYGAPGAGKTHLCAQVAEALSLPYYPVPLGPTSTESKLLGYRNLATGEFVKGALFDPYVSGGVVGLDEIDVADPSVLVGCNAIASNDRFRFPDGGTVMKHKDFILIAGANTVGTGATGGYTRNRLDAATLDRFVKLRLEYDADLEATLCGNRQWAEYVWKVREYVAKHCSGSIHITPRASINGAALLAAGLPPQTVAESTLFALCSADVRATITSNVGEFNAK